MSSEAFLANLSKLNSNIKASPQKKQEVYAILVAHNEKAEADFVDRLAKRKEAKRKLID